MGIILRYLCWVTHRQGAWRLTGRPTYPSPPLSRPPKVFAPGWGLEFEQAAPLGCVFSFRLFSPFFSVSRSVSLHSSVFEEWGAVGPWMAANNGGGGGL